MCMVVCFREHAPGPVAFLAAILLANGPVGGLNADEGLSISVRMSIAEGEHDLSGCRASGLVPELPVHVVLVPPLLVPPSLPAVMVTKNGHRPPHCPVDAWNFSNFFQHRRHAGVDVRRIHRSEVELGKTHFNSSKHTTWRLGPRHRIMQLLPLCFGEF